MICVNGSCYEWSLGVSPAMGNYAIGQVKVQKPNAPAADKSVRFRLRSRH